LLQLADFHGNHFIGVFCVCSDRVAFVPEQADDSFIEELGSVLEVEIERLSIDGSPLLGSLISMNSRGAMVANFALDADIERLATWVRVERMEEVLNAAGNNMLVNDKGALVHPDITDDCIDTISSVMGVPVKTGTVGKMSTVGASAVATNKGLLCHPGITDEEQKLVEKVLGVPSGIGTANFGSPLVGASIVSNTRGGLTGTRTTGVELNRIEDALGLY